MSFSERKKDDNRISIVIVGGGYSGAQAARFLSAQLDPSKYELILINSRPYQILLPATLRVVVSDADDLESQVFLPYDKLFWNGNGTFIHGTVSTIDDNGKGGILGLEDGEDVAYDVLVLAMGLKWEGPVDFPDDEEGVKSFIQGYRERLANAKNIVLAGGGAVALELAGEIKDIYPAKEVTIVHSQKLLLNNTYPDRFRLSVESAVRSREVKLILGDRLESLPDSDVIDPSASRPLRTRNGVTLNADLVLKTTGRRPSPTLPNLFSSLSSSSSSSSSILTPEGFIKVLPTLQLPSHPHIFAAGDIVDWKEEKQATKGVAHAKIITKNIQRYLAGKERTMVEYKGSVEWIIITNGKGDGRGYMDILWGIIFGSWFCRMVKSRSLVVRMMRRQNGY